MHMADALLSPAVGGVMWAATAGVTAWSIRKIKENPEPDEKKIPMMGVMGAFVFAAQMINFAIPGTGSSGHIGGGILLAILLGPEAGFLTIASVLIIQALFFGDGGLLALGANIFNMGFLSCFVAYPLIYKNMTKNKLSGARAGTAAVLACVVALQLGAFAVVLETVLSGRTELPFGTFVLFMQPIHLAIGMVEGLVTAAVVAFIWNARPEMLGSPAEGTQSRFSYKKILLVFGICAIVIGAGVSLLASAYPDGLEWSIGKVAGSDLESGSSGIHSLLAALQEKTSVFPDYQFQDENANGAAGTGVSGIAGGILTLVLAIGIGFIVKYIGTRKKRRQ